MAAAGLLAAAFVAIQFIPVNRSNPPVTTHLAWDSPRTRELAYRACMDCHSNETTWPWYTRIAPASWLTYYDVERGRAELNLSTYAPSSGGQPSANPFEQRPNDLAYRLGRILAEGGERRGPPPGSQAPRPEGGQGGGQFPRFNLSDQLKENILNNRMPPANYLLIHTAANLNAAEREELLQGLVKTLGLK